MYEGISFTQDSWRYQFIISIRNKISASMGSAQRKHRANWINYIEKHEIIYRLEKSMTDMVFEG